ncbi:MAG: glutamine--tRNA ligase/YqeY domain fusion protein [Sandaracinaceae bacterium]
MTDASPIDEAPGNFIRDIMKEDLATGRRQRIVTRFPPEPNGYLHIGHAFAINADFGLAKELGGQCNLRFDDTNPVAEDTEYVEGIKHDIRWLGFAWHGAELYASDYFGQLYEWAEKLIEDGKAYVDSQSIDEIRKGRGSFHEPGVDSPYRDRTVDENLALFRKMRDGELDEGEAVLRAKIDMRSPDIKLRDPLMYRIRKTPHHRTGTKWVIYPMYDWAHGQSDAIEGITHSMCSLEFVNHRPLYDWFLRAIGVEDPPKQYEFGRLRIAYLITSKRKLLQLVKEGHVDGWDDPRMPTLRGMRRLGIPPEAIRAFCDRMGLSKRDGVVDFGAFEYEVRKYLNDHCPRAMGVLDPVKLVIENYPEGQTDHFDCPLHPDDTSHGTRRVPFTRELYIEREDFMETPSKKWFRLAPGQEVRLRYAAIVRCTGFEKDADGRLTVVRCTWDPDSRGGGTKDGRKIRGTIHWVSAEHAVDAEARLYDRLFTDEDPGGHEDADFLSFLNPESKRVVSGVKLEPWLGTLEAGTRVQLERLGYFVTDSVDHGGERRVFNRTITLKDTWAKMVARGAT